MQWGSRTRASLTTAPMTGGSLEASDAFIAHLSPARVLREVESKRRIVDECAEILSTASHYITVESCDETDAILAEHIIRALGLPYADRPGYQESWRP